MGRVWYVSAKTRRWAKAEELIRKMMDERDPVKIALPPLENRENAALDGFNTNNRHQSSALVPLPSPICRCRC
jgi:hypothetical protein